MNTRITQTADLLEADLETTLTQKGQVTIPAPIRTHLGLKPKDKVRFEFSRGKVTLKPAPSKIAKYFGIVTPRKRPEDWKKMRAEVEQAIADEVVSEG